MKLPNGYTLINTSEYLYNQAFAGILIMEQQIVVVMTAINTAVILIGVLITTVVLNHRKCAVRVVEDLQVLKNI